jgi:hypothetical protein
VRLANEALVRRIKEIIAAGRAGTIDDTYDGYRKLFADVEFTQSEPADQRQALKLMILAKSPPRPATPAMLEAHRAAMGPLAELVRVHAEPADHELLGVCHMLLGDDDQASAVFRAGLAIERTRNPSSDLCGQLMKRISQA